MNYKTSELTGALLDSAVAKALGMNYRIQHYSKEQWDGIQQPFDGDVCIVSCRLFQPSTSWVQGGTIIERERMRSSEYEAELYPGQNWHYWTPTNITGHGETQLIAAMRALVLSKLGDEVEL